MTACVRWRWLPLQFRAEFKRAEFKRARNLLKRILFLLLLFLIPGGFGQLSVGKLNAAIQQNALGKPAVEAVVKSRHEKLIQQELIPAYRMDNKFALEIALKKLAARMTLAERETVDQLLMANEAEPLESLFVTVRSPKVFYSEGSAAPTNSPIELQLVLNGLYQDIEKQLKNLQSRIDLVDREVESFKDFERKLIQLRELNGNAIALLKQAAYVEHLRKHGRRDYRRHLEKNGSESALAASIAGTNTTELRTTLQKIRTRTIEDELVSRIYRLENATSALSDSETSTRMRIEAGMVVAVDGGRIPELLKRNRAFLTNPDLTDEELPETIQSLVAEAKRDHGRVIELGGRLSAGMGFWLQGRYGMGSDFGGLAKLPFTFTGPNAQGELYMPPLPFSKRVENKTIPVSMRPEIERRHLYVSAYPYRKFDCNRVVVHVPTMPIEKPIKTGPKPEPKQTKKGYKIAPGKSHIGQPSKSHIGKPAKSYKVKPGNSYFGLPGPSYVQRLPGYS